MKKKKRRKFKWLTLLFLSGFLIAFMLVAGIISAAAALFSQAEGSLGNQENQATPGINSFPPAVERYRNTVTLYCEQYNICLLYTSKCAIPPLKLLPLPGKPGALFYPLCFPS